MCLLELPEARQSQQPWRDTAEVSPPPDAGGVWESERCEVGEMTIPAGPVI